jgi:hypothetical protein
MTGPAPDETSAQQEGQHHHYTGNRIPWYVRLIWIGFWVFAVAYTIRFLFPALRLEVFNQP